MILVGFFFFKQKTAYEMRISDWSLDVCSSDLLSQGQDKAGPRNRRARRRTAAAVAPARSAKNLGDEFPAAGRTIRDDRSGAQPRQRLARRGGWRLSTPRLEQREGPGPCHMSRASHTDYFRQSLMQPASVGRLHGPDWQTCAP